MELGHKLNYDAVVNYAGNAFCEKSWEMITESNPFHAKEQKTEAIGQLASFFAKSNITVLKADEKE